MASKSVPDGRLVYLDKLTLAAAWRLLWIGGLMKVTVLDAINRRQRVGRWLLNSLGVQVVEAAFFAGHLKTADGESVRRASRRMAGQISLNAAKEIVQSELQLHTLNESYGRNTIRLFVAKQLQSHIDEWTLRALVSQALCIEGRAEVWMKKPTRFNERFLHEAFQGMDLHFYPSAGFEWIKLAMTWTADVLRDTKLIHSFGHRTRHAALPKTNKPAVLTMQEDHIRADRSLRGQPHWLDTSDQAHAFNTFVVKLLASNLSTAADADRLSQTGVTLIPTSAFRVALREMRMDKTLKCVRRDRRRACWAALLAREHAGKFFLLKIASLLRQAELMGAMALWLNVRVFLIRETYYTFADAMQLVAPALNVTTVAYQYSNMAFVSPLMMSTADKFLLFSDMYKALYQAEGIAPQEFLPTGYLYDGVADHVREKARKYRADLIRAGANFIVCYFDESVQHDRWGGISKDDHLAELYALANTVLNDPTFGVVVKSQFIFNSPTQLYPGDELLRRAKRTGRYIELIEGVHRNDIYPTEAALVADLCIGYKPGATAALEAALAGVRTVLLGKSGTKSLWDDIYARADIEYETIDTLMKAISRYRAGNVPQTLGDWEPILNHFDPYRDGKSVSRLRQILEKSVASA